MQIKYLGHSSFFIKGREGKLVTDPYDNKVGLKFPKTEADIVTVSHHHPDHDAVSGVSGDLLVVDLPGEFEKKGIRIFGHKTFHDKSKGAERGENIIFKIAVDDIAIVHCGDLGLIPDDEFIDELGDVDILLVPVGGHYTIDAKEAADLIKKLEPSIVIPMHYNREGLNPEIFEKLTTVDEFLKQIGVEPGETVKELTVKKEDLHGEMKIVVMDITS